MQTFLFSLLKTVIQQQSTINSNKNTYTQQHARCARAGTTILAITLIVPHILAKQPNIVFFLTDDQDQMLGGSFPPTAPGGATPMPKTKQLFQTGGSTATNFFIHTPICCPSRAETVTGRYFRKMIIKNNKAYRAEKLLKSNYFHIILFSEISPILSYFALHQLLCPRARHIHRISA